MKILHIGKEENINRYLPDWKTSVKSFPTSTSIEEILSSANDADYLIADAVAPITKELIEGMPNLKMIHSEGVAYNSFDVETAKERHVYVCNCKGMNAVAVAEQTVLLMLGVIKNVVSGDEAVRNGQQIQVKEGYMARGDLLELSDLKIGLIGFGDIAKAVAKMMQAFGAKTYYYSRHQADPEIEEKYDVEYLPLDKLCEICNMFSLHIPVTPETTHMIDSSFFEKIPDNSYIINTARGEVMDTQALVEAIQSGKIKMAGLDTLEGEPVKLDNYLLQQDKEVLDRILFSPHIGGITASSFKRGYQMIWNDIEKLEKGNKPDHVVNDWD